MMSLISALSGYTAAASMPSAISQAYMPSASIAAAAAAPVNDRTTQQDTVTISAAGQQAYNASSSSDGDSDGS